MYGLISRLVETQTNRFINMFVNTNILRVSVLRSYQQVVENCGQLGWFGRRVLSVYVVSLDRFMPVASP